MSSPTDPNLMAPEVLAKFRAGEALETARIPINMVDLPLGATVGLYKLNPVSRFAFKRAWYRYATEDRVCGTIDIEKALTEGTKAFEPGLLAKVGGGCPSVNPVST